MVEQKFASPSLNPAKNEYVKYVRMFLGDVLELDGFNELKGGGFSMDFTNMILLDVPADYGWDTKGIMRIGKEKDIAAYLDGDCLGRCLIFCHGNGETAVSERHWFNKLSAAGVSVICPEYRGYALSAGKMSEEGCYEAAHAAYDFLVNEKGVRCEDIFVLGYSLGSAIAVELTVTQIVGGLILQAPFISGRRLKRCWLGEEGLPIEDDDKSFPTASRLSSVHVPTLVIHGKSDDVIPFSHGEAVFNRIASNEKAFVPVEYAGHCNFQARLGEDYIPLLSNFISKGQLPPNPPSSAH